MFSNLKNKNVKLSKQHHQNTEQKLSATLSGDAEITKLKVSKRCNLIIDFYKSTDLLCPKSEAPLRLYL